MNNNDKTLESYDKNAQKYVDSLAPEIHGQFRVWIDRALGLIKPGTEILEIGSGSGREADYIEARGYSVLRTDASKGFIEYLQRNGKAVKRLNVLHDELGENLTMIFAQAVLHHFDAEQFEQILEKARTSLKPGGLLVFSVKQGEGETWTQDRIDAPRFYTYWQKSNLTSAIKRAKLRVLEISETKIGKTVWLLVIARK